MGISGDFRNLLKGTTISFVLKLCGMLLGYLSTLFVAKNYGAEGVGVIAVVFSLASLFATVCSLGLNTSVLRYVGQYRDPICYYGLREIYSRALILCCAALFIVFFVGALAYGSSTIVRTGVSGSVIFAIVIAPFLIVLNFNIEFIRALNLLKYSEILRSITRPAIIMIFLFFAGYLTNVVTMPIYALTCAVFVSFLMSAYVVKRHLFSAKTGEKQHESSSPSVLELLKTSGPMYLVAILSFLIANMPIFFLEYYSGSTSVGVYSVALKLALLINIVPIAINTYLAPQLSALYWRGDFYRLQKILIQANALAVFSSIFGYGVIYFFSETMLHFFGDEFQSAKKVLLLLGMAQLINAFAVSVGVLLNMTGHQKVVAYCYLGLFTFSLLAHYYFIELFGLIAVAYIALLVSILTNVPLVVFAKIQLNLVAYFSPKMLANEYLGGRDIK